MFVYIRLSSENHKKIELKQGKQTSEAKIITQKISLEEKSFAP